MQPQTIDRRVERLEQRVTILEELPSRVDALALQVSQLREEMHAEFSAVRGEMNAGLADVQGSLREEIRVGDEETRRILREEIRAGDKEIMAQARVLHEDVKATLALIEEGRSSSRRRRPKE